MYPVISISLANDSVFFDETLSRLLYQIDRTHTVRDACTLVGISYSSAWNKIRLLEEQLGCTVVRRSQGGAVGAGRSGLTEKGQVLLSLYESFSKKVSQDGNRHFHDTFDNVFTKEVFLICCGSVSGSRRNYEDNYSSLDSTGRVQSCLLWHEFNGKSISRVLCADSISAMQTAEIIFGRSTAVCAKELSGSSPAELLSFFYDNVENYSGSIAFISDAGTVNALLSVLSQCGRESITVRDGSYCCFFADGGVHLKAVVTQPHPELGRLLCEKILQVFLVKNSAVDSIPHHSDSLYAEALYSGEFSEEKESAEILRHIDGCSGIDVHISDILDSLGYHGVASAIAEAAE